MDISTVEIQDAQAVRFRERMMAYVELTKPRIAVMLLLTTAAGFYLGNKGYVRRRSIPQLDDRDRIACVWRRDAESV